MRKLLYDLLVMQKCILHVMHKLYRYYHNIIYIQVNNHHFKGNSILSTELTIKYGLIYTFIFSDNKKQYNKKPPMEMGGVMRKLLMILLAIQKCMLHVM